MIAILRRLFGTPAPVLSEATSADAGRFAILHATSFGRGWSEDEMVRLLGDPSVIAHRAMGAGNLAGFILSRIAADEAEILSVAVDRRRRGRGLARALLDLHLRRLAGAGVAALFLEVDPDNQPARRLYAHAGFREVGRRAGYYVRDGAPPATALVLRRDLV